MKKNLKNKKERGITLIALVVTIVVLLILAGVSINFVLGNNGIINKTKDAKVELRASTVEEQRDLWLQDRYISKNSGETPKSMDEILSELQENNILTADEVLTIKNNQNNEIKIGSKTISFKVEDGNKDDNVDTAQSTYFIWETTDTEAKITGLKDEAKQLEDILVPDIYEGLPVTTLNAQFSGTKMKNITIGKNINSINIYAFIDSKNNPLCPTLENINVNENNKKYSSIDGVLFSKDAKEIIQYPFNKSDEEYTMPNSTEKIGDLAFACTKVKKINFSDNLKCVTGYASFKNAEIINGSTVTIPKSLNDRNIVFYFLMRAENVETINVEDGNRNFKSIDGVLFNTTGTILYCYPRAKKDTTYQIPDETKVVGVSAFWKCKNNPQNIIFGENLKGIKEYAFNGVPIVNITMNEKINTIESMAFFDNSKLRSINAIPQSLNKIGDDVFYESSYLSQEIKDKIKAINTKAFFTSGGGASNEVYGKYDYDMNQSEETGTRFENTNDAEFD